MDDAIKHLLLEYKPECDERCDIQHDDPNLVEGHTGIVERIKGFRREAEPSAVEAVHIVMSKTEDAKPDHKERVVEGETVAKFL